jgi:hypothetical protein
MGTAKGKGGGWWGLGTISQFSAVLSKPLFYNRLENKGYPGTGTRHAYLYRECGSPSVRLRLMVPDR